MLDKKDAIILDSLRQNSRKTVKEIGRETGIPRTTVFERIKRMEHNQVIKGYSVKPDYEKIGFPTTAFTMVAHNGSAGVSQKSVAKEIAKLPGVYEVQIVAGEWDMLVKVRGRSLESIGDLVVGRMRDITGIARTLTYSVFYTIREDC